MVDQTKTAYCIWCREKPEEEIAEKLRDGYGYEVLIPQKQRFYFMRGAKSIITALLTPGYLFFYTDAPIDEKRLDYLKKYDHILEYTDGASALVGSDYDYAMWIYKHRGMIGISQGIYDQGARKAHFVDGPVTELGEVAKVDRHRQCAYVKMPFMNGTQELCLAFDWAAA